MANVYTTHVMSEKASRSGTYIVPISAFYDDAGAAVTPDTVSWTLYDEDDTVVNSREDVSETPAAAIDIVLYGDDLACADDEKPGLSVKVTYTYDSDAGNDLPAIMRIYFTIDVDV